MFFEDCDKEAKTIIKRMHEGELERLSTIAAMHSLVLKMNDPDPYTRWINLVPDEANVWDFIDFAENKNGLFDEAVKLFKELWASYASRPGGLYIGDMTY